MYSYLLVWRTYNRHLVDHGDKFWLVGPFDTDSNASAWAFDNNPHDNPCWQVIRLANAGAPVEVIPPFEPMPE